NVLVFFFKQKTAYAVATGLEFRRVLFRSWLRDDGRNRNRSGDCGRPRKRCGRCDMTADARKRGSLRRPGGSRCRAAGASRRAFQIGRASWGKSVDRGGRRSLGKKTRVKAS